ncbi:glycosyltransferase family 4 protein [Chryseobacterium sp.]|uniref:glycosyltransferase family 4 protein n=1 Tax=Chryseobacterium sp. TaxID=1871047 RepID=UPI0011CC5FA7|nr:glycosyltransferase family 1 protein [Chryseobacterium sp.]TXF77222.1 glycosyltransferase family 4 protein [Chryseobacterium sp.]
MNKSVLVDCERMKYPNSGIANVCRSLVNGIEELKSDFDITFYGPEDELKKINSTHRILDTKPLHRFLPPKTSDYALIHVTHQLSKYFHKISRNQKKVVTLHDLNFLHDVSKSSKRKKYIRKVQQNIGNADAIVCISEFAKKDFLAQARLFKLKENISVEVVHNGLVFPELRIFQSETYGFLKSKKYLLSVGVLFPKKNQLVLLDFLAKTDLDLVLVASSSKPDYKNLFLDKIKELKLEKRVHIFENVEEKDKFFLLQNCEAYVHPSLAEGFGIPPIEAFYFGKPVFLSRLTSLPEIGGDLAFYFDDFSAENMVATYSDDMENFNKNRENLERKYRERALGFSYLHMAENYLNVYQKLLK